MHPTIETLTREVQAARQVLAAPSQNDPTFRAMLLEIAHGQEQMTRVDKWLSSLPDRLAGLDAEIEKQKPAQSEVRPTLAAVPDDDREGVA